MDLNKLKGQLQTEVDTAFLYESIAAIQSDDNLTRVLDSLAEIEKGYAQYMLNKVFLFSGFRQVAFRLAAAVTYGIGTLIGVSLAG